MKKLLLILVAILWLNNIVQAQIDIVDSCYFLRDNIVQAKGKLFLFNKLDTMSQVQEQMIRNDDTSFLYTQYFKYPNLIERQGIVRYSNRYRSDSLIMFDTETYEPKTLYPFVPVGEWNFYYPNTPHACKDHNNHTKASGSYVDGKRHGKWSFWDNIATYNLLAYEITYEDGKEIERNNLNKCLDNNLDSLVTQLENTYISPFDLTDTLITGDIFSLRGCSDPCSKVGFTYVFSPHSYTLNYQKKVYVKKKKCIMDSPNAEPKYIPTIIESKQGTFSFKKDNILTISINNKNANFKILFLSKMAFLLKKL